MANALSPGTRLDRYELLGLLAEGGMASVRLARMTGSRGFEKLVAIKTIKSEHGRDKEFEHMFLDEARIASRVEHPNVAQIIDLGEASGILYLVMELVDGDAVSRLRAAVTKAGAQFPLGIAMRIIADTCAGLHAAHELRDERGNPLEVVHRDVSPQNILISTRGAVKLIDFGIVKAKNRMLAETEAGTFKGKIHYMPPEQALGGRIDRRVDIWAVGACLQFLLTGRKPYEPLGEADVIQELMAGRPPPSLPPEWPEIIRAILGASLAMDPRHRFESAAAMQRALEGALNELRTPTTSDDVATFAQRYLVENQERRRAFMAQALDRAAARAAGYSSGSYDAGPMSRSNPAHSIHRPEGTRAGYDEHTPSNPQQAGALKSTQVATGAAVTGPGKPFVSTAVVVREPDVVDTGPTFPAALAMGPDPPMPQASYPAPPPAFDAPPSRPVPVPREPMPTYDNVRPKTPTVDDSNAPVDVPATPQGSGKGRTLLWVLVVLALLQGVVILVLYGREWFGGK